MTGKNSKLEAAIKEKVSFRCSLFAEKERESAIFVETLLKAWRKGSNKQDSPFVQLLGDLRLLKEGDKEVAFPKVLSALGNYTISEWQNTGVLGATFHDPYFRAILKKKLGKTFPPALPLVNRAWEGDKGVREPVQEGDGSSGMSGFLAGMSSGKYGLMHVGTPMGWSLAPPSLVTSIKDALSASRPVEKLRELVWSTGNTLHLHPWFFWHCLPEDAREVLLREGNPPGNVYGDAFIRAAGTYQELRAVDFTSHAAAVRKAFVVYTEHVQAAMKRGYRDMPFPQIRTELFHEFTNFTKSATLEGFASRLRRVGCPPDKGNMLWWGFEVLTKKPALSHKMEVAYTILARCATHGLFHVTPRFQAPDEQASEEAELLWRNPNILYPVPQSTISGKPQEQVRLRKGERENPAGAIREVGRRVHVLLERLGEFLGDRNVPDASLTTIESAWVDFLARYGTPGEERVVRGGQTGDPGKPHLEFDLQAPAGRRLEWLHFTKGLLLEAMEEDFSSREVAQARQAAFDLKDYRFLVNYVGGQLRYLAAYFAASGDLAQLRGSHARKKFEEDPVAFVVLFLEIAYVVSLVATRKAGMGLRKLYPRSALRDIDVALATGQLPLARRIALKDACESVVSRFGPEVKKAIERVADSTAGSDDGRELARKLRQAREDNDWIPFLSALDDWQEDAPATVGDMDLTPFFKDLASDGRVNGELNALMVKDAVTIHFLRSLGFFFPSEYPDFADLEMTAATRRAFAAAKAERARLNQSRTTGSKGPLRAGTPAEVLEALSKVIPGNTPEEAFRVLGSGETVQTLLNGGRLRARDLVAVRVPGGRARVLVHRYMWYAASRLLGRRLAHFDLNCGDSARLVSAGRKGEVPRRSSGIAKRGKNARKDMIVAAGETVADLRAEDEAEQVGTYDLLLDSLKQSPPELAAWLYSGRVTGASFKALQGALRAQQRKVDLRDVALAARRLHNRFDRALTAAGDRWVNRRALPARLMALQLSLEHGQDVWTLAGSARADFLKNKKLERRMGPFRAKGLLSYADPRFYENLEIQTQGEIKRYLSAIGLSGEILAALVETIGAPSGKNLGGVFDAFNGLYPSIAPLLAPVPAHPLAPSESGTGESGAVPEGETENENGQRGSEGRALPTLTQFALALLRGLALHYETSLATLVAGKKPGQNLSVSEQGINRSRKLLLRAAYAQQYFAGLENYQGGGDANARTAEQRVLEELGIPKEGLARVIAGPAILPHKGAFAFWGRFIAAILADDHVLERSLAPSVLEAEDRLTRMLVGPRAWPFSVNPPANMTTVASKMLAVAGTLARFANRDDITGFVQRTEEEWSRRANWLDSLVVSDREEEVDNEERILAEEDEEASADEELEGLEVMTDEAEDEGGDGSAVATMPERLRLQYADPFRDAFPRISLPRIPARKPPRTAALPLPLSKDNRTLGRIDAFNKIDTWLCERGEDGAFLRDEFLVHLDTPPFTEGSPELSKGFLPECIRRAAYARLEYPAAGDAGAGAKEVSGAAGNLGKRWVEFARQKQASINTFEDEANTARLRELALQARVDPLDIIAARRSVISRVMTRWYYEKGSGIILPAGESLEVTDGDLAELTKTLAKSLAGFTKRLGAYRYDVANASIEAKESESEAAEGANSGEILEKDGTGEKSEQNKRMVARLSVAEKNSIKSFFAPKAPVGVMLEAQEAARVALVRSLGEQGTAMVDKVDNVLRKIPRAVLLPDEHWVGRVDARFDQQFPEESRPALVSYVGAWQHLRKQVASIGDFLASSINQNSYVPLAKDLARDKDVGAVKAAGEGAVPVGKLPEAKRAEQDARDVHRVGKMMLRGVEETINGLARDTRKLYNQRNKLRVLAASAVGYAKAETKRKQGGKKVRGADILRYKAKAVEFLVDYPPFKDYFEGQDLIAVFRVSRRLLRLLRAKEEHGLEVGAATRSFRVMMPRYPAKHVAASLEVAVPWRVDHACPPRKAAAIVESRQHSISKLRAKRKWVSRTAGDVIIEGDDLNRFSSRYTVTPGILEVSAGAKDADLPGQAYEGADEALLQGAYCYATHQAAIDPVTGQAATIKAGPLVSYGRAKQEDDPSGAGELVEVKAAEQFLARQMTSMLASAEDSVAPLRMPDSGHPYHAEQVAREPDFLDKISAVEYFRGTKVDHLGYHAFATRRRRRTVSQASRWVPDNTPTPIGRPEGGRQYALLPAGDARRLRLRAGAAGAENAATYLRLASIESQQLKLFYRVVRFALDGVAYERKKFSATGRRGSLGGVLRKMPQDFTDFKKRVEWLLGLFDCDGIIDWKAVPAPGTSVRCFAHPDERVDRRVTVDWGYHPGSGGTNAHGGQGGKPAIIADHLNAALNIAFRHPLVAGRVAAAARDRRQALLIRVEFEAFERRQREWVRKNFKCL